MKNFEDSHNKLCYYNVEKGFIGTNGHSKTLYTQEDYYSQLLENYLNRTFETPFSKIVYFIKDVLSPNANHKKPPANMEKTCIDFAKMLVARDETVQNRAKEVMVHSQFAKKISISDRIRRDTVVSLSLKNLEEMPYTDDIFVTFSINQTDIPFVLPTCDIIEYEYEALNHMTYSCLSIVITPQILVTLIDKRHLSDFIIDDGYISFIRIKDAKNIIAFNETAFKNQKERGYGYVVSNDLTILEDLNKKFEVNNE